MCDDDTGRSPDWKQQWLRPQIVLTGFVAVVGTSVLAYRFWRLPDPIDFRLTDLLAMFLALFAIGLSAAFYFRGTKDSYVFFDRMYEFTMKSTETLARIEGSFSEQLRRISEASEHVRDRVDQMPSNPYETAQLREEEEEEKSQLLESLMQRAQLSDAEADELRHELRRRDSQIAALSAQMAEANARLNERSEIVHQAPERTFNVELEEYLRLAVLPEFGLVDPAENSRAVRRRLSAWLGENLHHFSSVAARDLESFGYIEEGRITAWGWQRIRRLLPWRRTNDEAGGD
jgi:hypothetical protein